MHVSKTHWHLAVHTAQLKGQAKSLTKIHIYKGSQLWWLPKLRLASFWDELLSYRTSNLPCLCIRSCVWGCLPASIASMLPETSQCNRQCPWPKTSISEKFDTSCLLLVHIWFLQQHAFEQLHWALQASAGTNSCWSHSCACRFCCNQSIGHRRTCIFKGQKSLLLSQQWVLALWKPILQWTRKPDVPFNTSKTVCGVWTSNNTASIDARLDLNRTCVQHTMRLAVTCPPAFSAPDCSSGRSGRLLQQRSQQKCPSEWCF